MSGTQDDQEERFVLVELRSHKISIEQYSSSGTTATVLQALAFVPVATVYVCLDGTQQQEIEP